MKSFKDLFEAYPVHESLIRSIEEQGFAVPTPIQAQALPALLGKPTDFIGLAATGTGKTVAFSLPMLQRIDFTNSAVQALILCPTRELAMQVCEQVRILGKHLGARTLAVYGGAGYGDQLKGLRKGAHVVVGTPGRVVDHLKRGTLDLSQVSTLILDEADEMISMGFKEDLQAVLEAAPQGQSNIWLFSATMSREVRRVADEYLSEPFQVEVNRTAVLAAGVEQIYYVTSESNKPEVLCKLIDAAPDFYGIVFCQTKALVADLAQYLGDRGYSVDCLHGDKDQNARERTMKSFRDRRVQVLICTDVASRGLDVKDITHVINYSIPRELDSYVHRIGRTARSGKTGYALSLVTPANRSLIPRIERMTKSRMVEGKLPTRKDVAALKTKAFLAKFLAAENYVQAMELVDEAWITAVSAMTPQEIIGRFLALSTGPHAVSTGSSKQSTSESTPSDFSSERRRPERTGRSFDRPARERSFGSSRPVPSQQASPVVMRGAGDRAPAQGPLITLDSFEADKVDGPRARHMPRPRALASRYGDRSGPKPGKPSFGKTSRPSKGKEKRFSPNWS